MQQGLHNRSITARVASMLSTLSFAEPGFLTILLHAVVIEPEVASTDCESPESPRIQQCDTVVTYQTNNTSGNMGGSSDHLIAPSGAIRFCEALAVSVGFFEEDQATQSNPSEFYQNAQPGTKCRGVTGAMYNDWHPGSHDVTQDTNHCTSIPSRPCTWCAAVHFGRTLTDYFVSLDLF